MVAAMTTTAANNTMRKEFFIETSLVRRDSFLVIDFFVTFLVAVFLGAVFLLAILINTNKF